MIDKLIWMEDCAREIAQRVSPLRGMYVELDYSKGSYLNLVALRDVIRLTFEHPGRVQILAVTIDGREA